MQNFSLLPLYFSRNPILLFNEEYINLDRIDITSLVNDDFIQNLVFRNSKNLHTVLKNYENLNEIQKNNFDLAFSNYLTRLCSRPTPFDINSIISLNYLTEQLETDDMSLNYNIHLSSDLFQFIKNDILNNADKINKLKVKFNKLNLDKNNHYHFYYLHNNESNQSENLIFKISKTNILSDIDDLTQNNFIEISEIINFLKHKYTEVDSQKVLIYLLNLISPIVKLS